MGMPAKGGRDGRGGGTTFFRLENASFFSEKFEML